MLRLPRIVPVSCLLLLCAGSALAAPLKWKGTLEFDLGPISNAFVTGQGVATVNGPGGFGALDSLRLDGGIAKTGLSIPVTDPEVIADGVVAVQVTASIADGTLSGFAGGPPLTNGAFPLKGIVRLCIFDPACLPGGFVPLELSFHTPASSTGGGGVGIGGLLTVGGFGPIRVSLVAHPWTIAQASAVDQVVGGGFTTVFKSGFVHGPDSLTSSTALPSGVVKFVTPLQVSTNITGGASALELISVFGALTLHFVPEPGALLLLGSGVLALVALGSARWPR